MSDKTTPRKGAKPGDNSRPGGRNSGRTPTSAAAKARAAAAAKPGGPKRSGPPSTSARQQQKALRGIKSRNAARRKTWLQVGLPIALVVLVVAGLVIAKVVVGGKDSKGVASSLASATTVSDLQTIPLATFNTVKSGSVTTPPVKVSGPALTGSGGLPEVLYMGAEYCPYCAAERWGTVAALMRFGTFTNLGQTASSPNDTNPSTPTLSFHGASYTSKYVSFSGVEMQGNDVVNGNYATLDTPTSAQTALLQKYDYAPYVQGSGGIPFIDFGNTYIQSGASYDGSILSGLTHEQIAQDAQDPSSKVGQAIVGTANVQTAAICQLTNNQPANVCTSAGVVAAKSTLPTKITGPST